MDVLIPFGVLRLLLKLLLVSFIFPRHEQLSITGASGSIIAAFASISSSPRTFWKATKENVKNETHRFGIFELEEFCSKRNLSMTISGITCGSSDILADNRESSSYASNQCRVACKAFSDPDYEVTYLGTRCGFCDDMKADQFLTKGIGSTDGINICIPRSVCIHNCGKERPGCVYTGSCQGMICVLKRNSKRPATFLSHTDSKDGTKMSMKIKITDVIPGMSNSKVTKGPSLPGQSLYRQSSSSASGTVSVDTTSNIGPSEGTSADPESSKSKWVWLGPILGFLGAALIAITSVIAAYINISKNNTSEKRKTEKASTSHSRSHSRK